MAAPAPLPLELRPLPGRTVLRFRGCDALDAHHSETAARQLALLPDGLAGEDLVLDLGGVRHVSSAGLLVLVAFSRRVRLAGGSLRLAGVGPAVRAVLAVTRLDRLIGVLRSDDAPATEAAPSRATAQRGPGG